MPSVPDCLDCEIACLLRTPIYQQLGEPKRCSCSVAGALRSLHREGLTVGVTAETIKSIAAIRQAEAKVEMLKAQ
jgi:hypothetical protein